jgi:ketosteroid isomerase-like protein
MKLFRMNRLLNKWNRQLLMKTSTENMEVHHHPHVVKKNFKDYAKEFFIFLFILSFHQAFTQNMHNNDVAIIKSNRAASNEAITKHDVNGISKFWLDDFVQVIGRGTYDTGKESIAASWKALFNSNPQISYVRTPEEIIISDADTLAWERGKWIGIHSYSKGGNYAAMWIKRNGNWMLKAELFVSLKANKQQ